MTKATVQLGTTPFKEAVDYFRAKVNLPTESWRDLQGQMHAKAFVVAGVMREDILCDFRKAVDGAIAEGKTLQQFRKDFDSIVAKTGWQHNGTRNWRSEIIYSTNLAVAHAAGRERQMQDPVHRKLFPYGRYICMMDGLERPEHRAWHNTILPLDDPWWSTHTPPNGWRCRCRKEAVSKYDARALGIPISDKAPSDPTVEHIDRTTGEVTQIQKGIDPGWNYNPGDAANGKPNPPVAAKVWTEIPQQGFLNNPEKPTLPIHPLPKPAKAILSTEQEIKDAIDKKLDEQIPTRKVMIPMGDFTYAFNVDSQSLARHFNNVAKVDRQAQLNAIISAMVNPDEIRLLFMESATGKVAIRARFFKLFQEAGESKPVIIVFDAQKGEFISWTAYRMNMKEFNQQRTGFLLHQKKEAP